LRLVHVALLHCSRRRQIGWCKRCSPEVEAHQGSGAWRGRQLLSAREGKEAEQQIDGGRWCEGWRGHRVAVAAAVGEGRGAAVKAVGT
jgi:hypothetical protein